MLRNAVTDTNLPYSVISPVPALFLKNVNINLVVHVVTAYWIHNFLKFKAQVAVETEY